MFTRIFRKRRSEADFRKEIEAHLSLEAEQLRAEGHAHAQLAARKAFGNVGRAEEGFFESSRVIWITQFFQDLRYAARTLRRSPAFALIAIVSLALGIGANTAVFSVVDAVLLKSLPVRAPEELRILTWVRTNKIPVESHSGYGTSDPVTGQNVSGSFPYPAYRAFVERLPQFSELVAYSPNQFTLTADGSSDYAQGQFVSGNYFSGLGTMPLAGRPILPDDDRAGAPRVAVLTYRFWERRFGLDPNVIGKRIFVNQQPVTVIGVMPAAFQGLYPGRQFDLFVPLAMLPETGVTWYTLSRPDYWWVQVFGRIRPGVSDDAAASAIQYVLASVIESYAGQLKPEMVPTIRLSAGARGVGLLRDSFTTSIYILGVTVALILLIACTNLANLLLARAAGRQAEISVRLSIGAGRGRLVRQLFTESLLLAGLGAGLGLLVAAPLSTVMLEFAGGGARALTVAPALDQRTLWFTLGVSLLTALVFGLAPAWRATRVDLTPALKGAGRPAGSRMQASRLLVAAQVGLSVLLLVGAGLFVRTLRNLSNVDLGFRSDRVLTFQTDPSRNGYRKERLAGVYAQMLEKIGSIPGVEAVGMSQHPLIGGVESDTGIYVADLPRQSNPRRMSYLMRCSPSFLSAIHIPILAGRDLQPTDGMNAPRVAVVNEAFVKRNFGGGNPIGRTFYLGEAKPEPDAQAITIVGIAKDAHYTHVRGTAPPTAYFPFSQAVAGLQQMTFAIRTALPPLSIAPAVRQAVAAVDSTIPVAEMRTEEDQIANSLGSERLFAGLVSAFGFLAAALAAIGLYGVMAYTVARRTAEIGIRMALGAGRGRVLWLVVRDSLLMVALGLAAGVPAAYALTGLVKKTLFGVKPTDPLSFAAACGAMIVVAALAASLPARRAAKVDPVVALRYE
jgi:predicted permease